MKTCHAKYSDFYDYGRGKFESDGDSNEIEVSVCNFGPFLRGPDTHIFVNFYLVANFLCGI